MNEITSVIPAYSCNRLTVTLTAVPIAAARHAFQIVNEATLTTPRTTPRTTPSAPPIVVWFRDDLRLSDHPALHAAARRNAPVICLYILDEQSKALKPPQARSMGGATRWWLAQSLRALSASLDAIGGTLVLRKG